MPLSAITRDDFTPRTAEQAAKHFAKKAALTDEAFETLSDAAKTQAFRIATVHKANLAQWAQDVITRAIREGTPFDRVRRELLTRIDGVAWHRLRFVFQQNTMQAYNDARRETLDDPAIKAAFPYWQYLTVGNGTPGVNNVRPEHAALHGLVLPADDSFWDSHTPPWGYGCRCTFRPLTRGQVKRMGLKVRNAKFVRERVPVKGTRRRGIRPDPRFVRGAALELAGLDKELREAIERMSK